MAFIIICIVFSAEPSFAQKVVIIRHGEKPAKGENLNCQGLNRSLQLPSILYAKFGIPDGIYVPSLGINTTTSHARMFETVIPLAAKYNLGINSKFAETDSTAIARDIKGNKGFVLVVWEHRVIPSIVRALGVQGFNLKWDDNDYDGIWIITFLNGIATLTTDKEGLNPSSACP